MQHENTPAARMKKQLFVAAVMVAIVILGIGYASRATIKSTVMQIQARHQSAVTTPFPQLDTTGFTEVQLQLLEQLKAEYAKKPVSFDAAVLQYTDGVKEPWCADFVSWQMKELGQPLVNPHSGGWRIPGVYTLREYYQAESRWQSAGTYVPKFGDVAIYARSPAQSHTNIVLSVDTKSQTMQTIGGNEEGRVRIKTKSYLPPHEDLAGFGLLR
jgi:hypothetical protein